MPHHEPNYDDELDDLETVDDLDDRDRSARAYWRNIKFGAITTGVLATSALYGVEADAKRPLSLLQIVGFLGAAMTIGGMIGALLSMKDFVVKRLARGERVGCIPKLLFGSGALSLVVMSVVLCVVASVFVVVALRVFGS